jgi:type I restriction enzyme R subunit
MKGRGTRTISSTDFKAVTPDALNKTHFIIVDAVRVCENDKTDSRPLERRRTIPFDKLIEAIAMGIRNEDTINSLAGRLARMDREINEKDQNEIETAGQGIPLKHLINSLLDATDPDKQLAKAQEMFKTDKPDEKQIAQATKELVKTACSPFDIPKLRNTLIDIKKRNEQIIDTVSKDRVILAGFDDKAKEKARNIIDTFKKFIEENKDELTALQMIYSKPYGRRHLTYEEIKQLAEAIEKPPYFLTQENIWLAYEKLEESKVKKVGPTKLLTDIISLIRFTIGETESLEPFTNIVNFRFDEWLRQQEKLGNKFTAEQLQWLEMIKNHIATSLSITMADFDYAPFYEKGGRIKAYQYFGQELDKILEEMNEALVA